MWRLWNELTASRKLKVMADSLSLTHAVWKKQMALTHVSWARNLNPSAHPSFSIWVNGNCCFEVWFSNLASVLLLEGIRGTYTQNKSLLQKLRFVQACASAAAGTQDVGYKHWCLSAGFEGFSKRATACCTPMQKTFALPAFYLLPLL